MFPLATIVRGEGGGEMSEWRGFLKRELIYLAVCEEVMPKGRKGMLRCRHRALVTLKQKGSNRDTNNCLTYCCFFSYHIHFAKHMVLILGLLWSLPSNTTTSLRPLPPSCLSCCSFHNPRPLPFVTQCRREKKKASETVWGQSDSKPCHSVTYYHPATKQGPQHASLCPIRRNLVKTS